MGLIGNYSVLGKSPGRFFGGTLPGGGADRANYRKAGPMRGRFNAVDWEPKSGVPDGYRPPSAWIIPQVSGGIASRYVIGGTGTLTASGALGRNLLATIAGSGSLAADVTALGWMLGNLEGSGTLTGVRYATGALEADITPFTTLSPENLASAVWSAVAADNNDTGTMGEKVNDAGSASNPWTEVIEGSYTAAEMLRIIAAALAGELAGAGTTTITIQGIDATTDRIVATVDGTGNRTAVTLDGA